VRLSGHGSDGTVVPLGLVRVRSAAQLSCEEGWKGETRVLRYLGVRKENERKCDGHSERRITLHL